MASRTSDSAFATALREAGFDGPRGRARFSLEVGVDAVTVWRWTTGKGRPGSHGTRAMIAMALGRETGEVEAMFPEHDANGAAA